MGSMDVNTVKIQYLAIIGSTFILLLIFELIREKKIKIEYSLLWLFFACIFFLFSIWRDGLDIISAFMGIAYPPAALFLILIMAIFPVLIHFSIVISKLTEQNKNLTQELGLLKAEFKTLKESEKMYLANDGKVKE